MLDLHQKSIRKQKPDKVMHRRYYYKQEWAPEGIDVNILEKIFSKWIEGSVYGVINKLINEPSSLTGEDTASFIAYFLTQRIRVPRQAEFAKMLAKYVISMQANNDPAVAALIASGKLRIEINESVRFEFMKSALTKKIISYFLRMIWQIVQAPKSLYFVTTDSPVSFFNPQIPPPAEAGISLIGTKVLFPLSPKHLLILRHPERDSSSESDYVKSVPQNQIERNSIIVEAGNKFTQTSIDPINWTLALLADRLVVSNDERTLVALEEKLSIG